LAAYFAIARLSSSTRFLIHWKLTALPGALFPFGAPDVVGVRCSDFSRKQVFRDEPSSAFSFSRCVESFSTQKSANFLGFSAYFP
jgi:hypothetical protein